jgi:group II intron reverse transcriptase/maturase
MSKEESGEVVQEQSPDGTPGRNPEVKESAEARPENEPQSKLQETQLLEEILSLDNLKQAFLAVKRNNGAAGIDGVQVKDFEKNLREELRKLQQEVEERSYKPSPVRRVEIPKAGGGVRKLGIPTVRDRVFQQAIYLKLERLFEPTFSEGSYGFRPGRNQKQAVERAQELVREGKEWVVDIDLERCFDTLNHDIILNQLRTKVKDRRVLRLIGQTLRSGILTEGESEGAPQGSPLSPLLCNIVLDLLDKELERRGLSFCRYADDANIFVRSKESATRVMGSISRFIEKRLRLKVNREKSKVAKSKEVKFLGFTIVEGEIAISKKAMKRAYEKLRELARGGSHLPVEKQLTRFNAWYRGWSEYFKLTSYPKQLAVVEAHFRRRMRKQFIRNQKRKRHLFDKLIGAKIPRRLAGTVYGNRGPWALSHTTAVERYWSNYWFTHRGMFLRSTEDLPHWKPLSVWVKLV